jgi:hypothetical protein
MATISRDTVTAVATCFRQRQQLAASDSIYSEAQQVIKRWPLGFAAYEVLCIFDSLQLCTGAQSKSNTASVAADVLQAVC